MVSLKVIVFLVTIFVIWLENVNGFFWIISLIVVYIYIVGENLYLKNSGL